MIEYEDVVYLAGEPALYHERLPMGYGRRITRHFHTTRPDIVYLYFGNRHRVDGPAHIDLHAGAVLFFINGITYSNTREYCVKAEMTAEDSFIWVLRYGDELPTACAGFYGEGWKDMSIEKF